MLEREASSSGWDEVHYDMGFIGSTTVPMDRKSYFVFDLGGIGATISSASLELFAGARCLPQWRRVRRNSLSG